MKGVIIDNKEWVQTQLSNIFSLLGNIQNNYNWLITDYECYPQNEMLGQFFSGEPCYVTGEELTQIVRREDFQWIWGVLSAFPKSVLEEQILQYALPEAEGNSGIWHSPVTLQHPLAELELLAWDSTETVLISKDDTIAERLMQQYDFVEDLENSLETCDDSNNTFFLLKNTIYEWLQDTAAKFMKNDDKMRFTACNKDSLVVDFDFSYCLGQLIVEEPIFAPYRYVYFLALAIDSTDLVETEQQELLYCFCDTEKDSEIDVLHSLEKAVQFCSEYVPE